MKYTEAEQRTATQRLINEAYAHMQTTKAPSTEEDGTTCCYSGLGCAFSPAIKKAHRADKALSGVTAKGVIDQNPEVLYDWAKAVDQNVADIVQECHDSNVCDSAEDFLDSFCSQLNDLCKDFNYTYPGDK